jgi:hypothetical protein
MASGTEVKERVDISAYHHLPSDAMGRISFHTAVNAAWSVASSRNASVENASLGRSGRCNSLETCSFEIRSKEYLPGGARSLWPSLSAAIAFLLSIALVGQNACAAQRSLGSDWIITRADRRIGASAVPSLPATSLILISFLRRDSTQKSPQKIGSGYNASLSSPDQD